MTVATKSVIARQTTRMSGIRVSFSLSNTQRVRIFPTEDTQRINSRVKPFAKSGIGPSVQLVALVQFASMLVCRFFEAVHGDRIAYLVGQQTNIVII